MPNETFTAQAEAIFTGATSKLDAARSNASQYNPSIAEQKIADATEALKVDTRAKYAALEAKVQAERAEVESAIEAYRFPLNTAPANESREQRLSREATKIQAVAVAYTLPLFDAQAVEAMLAQGLRHLAFTYTDRNFKADVPEKLSAQRDVFSAKVGALLRKDATHAELMDRLRHLERSERRVAGLRSLAAAGAFVTPAKMSESQRVLWFAS